MSNVFTFKTLRTPSIRVITVEENLVRLRVTIECRVRSNLDDGFRLSSSAEDPNYLYRVLIYYPGSAGWFISQEKLIQEADFVEATSDPGYYLYSSEIEIGKLNSSVVYLIKLEHEISMASDEFFSSTHFVTSNFVKFSTLKKSE